MRLALALVVSLLAAGAAGAVEPAPSPWITFDAPADNGWITDAVGDGCHLVVDGHIVGDVDCPLERLDQAALEQLHQAELRDAQQALELRRQADELEALAAARKFLLSWPLLVGFAALVILGCWRTP